MTDPTKWHVFERDKRTGYCSVCQRPEDGSVHYRRVSHTKVVHEFAPDEKVMSMVIYRDCVIVATSHGLYRLVDEKLQPIQLLREEAKDDGRPNAE